jgi:hypothetical protein
MKTIYDHNRLIARSRRVDMRVLLEKSGECGRAERLRRATSCLPTLQGPHAYRQSRFDENDRRLRLAELVGFTPAPQVLNHGRHAFGHRLRLVANFWTVEVWVLLEELRERSSGDRVGRPMAYLPVLQGSELHGQACFCQNPYGL